MLAQRGVLRRRVEVDVARAVMGAAEPTAAAAAVAAAATPVHGRTGRAREGRVDGRGVRADAGERHAWARRIVGPAMHGRSEHDRRRAARDQRRPVAGDARAVSIQSAVAIAFASSSLTLSALMKMKMKMKKRSMESCSRWRDEGRRRKGRYLRTSRELGFRHGGQDASRVAEVVLEVVFVHRLPT